MRNVHPDDMVIDGCAMIHGAIPWPKGVKVDDLIKAIRSYISKKLPTSDVYLIFDRYRDTRLERLEQFRRSHNLLKSSPLPTKEVTLKGTKTKMQLIQMVASDLLDNLVTSSNKLIITAQQDEPEQVIFGNRIKREDLKTTQEKADVIIPFQVSAAIAENKKMHKSHM